MVELWNDGVIYKNFIEIAKKHNVENLAKLFSEKLQIDRCDHFLVSVNV